MCHFPKSLGNIECMWLLHKIATPEGHCLDNSVGLWWWWFCILKESPFFFSEWKLKHTVSTAGAASVFGFWNEPTRWTPYMGPHRLRIMWSEGATSWVYFNTWKQKWSKLMKCYVLIVILWLIKSKKKKIKQIFSEFWTERMLSLFPVSWKWAACVSLVQISLCVRWSCGKTEDLSAASACSVGHLCVEVVCVHVTFFNTF